MRKRANSAYFLGLVVWLAVAIIAGILFYTTLKSSRQPSADSSFSVSDLAMEAGADEVSSGRDTGTAPAAYELSSQIPLHVCVEKLRKLSTTFMEVVFPIAEQFTAARGQARVDVVQVGHSLD